MLDRAKRKVQMNLKDIEKIKGKRIYKGIDIGQIEKYEESYKGVIYHISPQYKFVIDDYDDVTSSIELSHLESVGYSVIDGYRFDPENKNNSQDTLDFRFTKIEDSIDIKVGEEITSIKLNSRNIRYTTIEGTKKLDFNIYFDDNIIDNVLSFRLFVYNNKKYINSINIEGLSDNMTLVSFIKRICAKNGIFEVTFIDNEETMPKKLNKKNN